MKQKAFLLIMILSINNLYADILDDFRQLSADEKIQKIFEEYRYDKNWSRRLRFSQYTSIMLENPEENIPVLFEYLEKLDMLPPTEDDNAYEIIENIIWRGFYIDGRLLKKEELDKLCIIYQRKIINYLETYKTIDIMVVLTEDSIEHIKNNRNIISLSNIGKILYKKYTKLGFTNLRLVYEPFSVEK